MKDIKFRCWNAHSGIMHSWGELVKLNKIHLLAEQNPRYPIMQYTGLKDCNGVEIYQDDILMDENSKAFLVSFDSRGAMMLMLGTETEISICEEIIDRFKLMVVGNKYENPELLK